MFGLAKPFLFLGLLGVVSCAKLDELIAQDSAQRASITPRGAKGSRAEGQSVIANENLEGAFKGVGTGIFGQDDLELLAKAIPGGGTPGVDYPLLSYVPETGFSCEGLLPGYYADTAVGSNCQVFHICQERGRIDSFLCPNGTLFNQRYFICDWWFNVDCSGAVDFYSLNAYIGKAGVTITGDTVSSEQFGAVIEQSSDVSSGSAGIGSGISSLSGNQGSSASGVAAGNNQRPFSSSGTSSGSVAGSFGTTEGSRKPFSATSGGTGSGISSLSGNQGSSASGFVSGGISSGSASGSYGASGSSQRPLPATTSGFVNQGPVNSGLEFGVPLPIGGSSGAGSVVSSLSGIKGSSGTGSGSGVLSSSISSSVGYDQTFTEGSLEENTEDEQSFLTTGTGYGGSGNEVGATSGIKVSGSTGNTGSGSVSTGSAGSGYVYPSKANPPSILYQTPSD